MTNTRAQFRPGVRQANMVEHITLRGEVSVEALAQKFKTSSETIRRDLTVLANTGQIQKIHGGAKIVSQQGEGIFETRMRQNALAKRLIAEKAVSLVKPHQTIFMDTGSTTLICAQALCRTKNLTVITNSTRIAATFGNASAGANIFLLGGQYRASNSQTVGAQTIAEIANYRADMAILTIGALDIAGATDFSNHEAMVARAMQKSASKCAVLADNSKFGHHTSFKVCGLESIDILVSDKNPSDIMNKALQTEHVKVL